MNMLISLYRKLVPLKVKGKNNKVEINSKLKNTTIRIFGNNNKLIIEPGCKIKDSDITINGNNSVVHIKSGFYTKGHFSLNLESNSTIVLGNNTGIRGAKLMASNANIIVGDNCMFSYDILIRTSDGHDIFDATTKELLNKADDVVLGNKVWICQNVTILKGVTIGNNSIVAYGSILTKSIPSNCIAAGAPAKVVKENVVWEK